jgi:O-antigen biosynthesis protein
MSNPPIDIIVPAFNQLAYCQGCVASIQQNTRRPYRLILVDNGSTDGVGPFFDTVPDAVVVHAQTNRGFAGGVNLGLRHARGHVVLLNSDTLVPPRWLDRLARALAYDDRIGIVGPVTNYASGPQQIDVPPLQSLDDIAAFAEALAQREHRRITDCYRLVGFCMLIRDTALHDVGLLDEQFATGNFEDDDYCLRTRRAGYRLCVAHNAFVYHFGNRTFAGMGLADERFARVLNENEQRFLAKWGSGAVEHSEQGLQADRLNAQAREALAQGRLDDALRLQAAAVEACPQGSRQHNDLGAVVWHVGDHDRARRCFERALALDAQNDDARANLEALINRKRAGE